MYIDFEMHRKCYIAMSYYVEDKRGYLQEPNREVVSRLRA